MLLDYEAADHSQIISLLRHIKLSAIYYCSTKWSQQAQQKNWKKKVPEDVQAHISVDIHIGNEAAGSKLDL